MTEAQAILALRELGISPSDFQAVIGAPTYPEKCQLLEALKERAKAGFREAARRLHPDIPENRTEEKRELFLLVRQALDDIRSLKIRPPRPRFVPVSFSFSVSPTATTAGTSTQSTNSGYVTIRIR